MKKLPLFLSLLILPILLAAPPALPLAHQKNLENYRGQTFLETISNSDGVKSALDEDYVREYSVAGWAQISQALENFDAKVQRKTLNSFAEGSKGLAEFVTLLEGTKFTPERMVQVVSPKLRGFSGRNTDSRKIDVYSVAQVIALGSGAGTLVTIDADNYYYNYGYASGKSSDDVKTGRSFGASKGHAANDASDVFFLKELELYLKTSQDTEKFYSAVLQILTQTDAGQLKATSESAQMVATDFIAIYTAELDRHLMTKLTKHYWENDLAEVVFIAPFSSVSGKIMKEGKFQDGRLDEYWAKSKFVDPRTGKPSNRSGIGITRGDRRALQKWISDFEVRNHPELIAEIEKIVGRLTGRQNIYQKTMEFLNNYRTQDEVRKNSNELNRALVNLIVQTALDAKTITREIQDRHDLGT